jgi:phosphohistidine phosphatase
MKTIYLVRHAHAQPGMADFERHLSDRGKKEATQIAQKLLKRNVRIDAWFCSSSKRTTETAELISSEMQNIISNFHKLDALYLASSQQLQEQIIQMGNDLASIAFVVHNPGVTELASKICSEVFIDEMPPCAVFAVQSDAANWIDFFKNKIEFLFFVCPG